MILPLFFLAIVIFSNLSSAMQASLEQTSHNCAKTGIEHLSSIIKNDCDTCMNFLIRGHKNLLTEPNSKGNTLLIEALMSGSIKVTLLLLINGANQNDKSHELNQNNILSEFMPALHYAVLIDSRETPKLIEALIKRGA